VTKSNHRPPADPAGTRILPPSVAAAIAAYSDRQILATFAFGMASGFPLTFVFSVVSIWLSREGISARDVGLFALAGSFYAWKVLWAPLVDWLKLGPITGLFGQRRGWLFVIQGLMTLCLFVVGGLDPKTDLSLIAFFVGCVGFLSASQDIVIDAYRIEIVRPDQQGHSASSYTLGYRFANWISGVAVLLIAANFGWQVAIGLLPVLFIPALLAALWIGEPEIRRSDDPDSPFAGNVPEGRAPGSLSPAQSIFTRAVIMPFRAFMQRDGWWLILIFIVFYKAGDAVTQIMMNPMIVDRGYTLENIAFASKTVGAAALIIGAAFGGFAYRSMGMYRALFVTGIFMMVTNLGFAWVASVDADVWRLALVVGLENFASGLGGVVAIAYFSSLCDVHYTATQYALISSLASQARTLLGAPSGFLADSVGWPEFFVIATLAALPGLVLLVVVARRDKTVMHP